MKDLLEEIDLPKERKLNLIVEGKPPIYYECGQKRHIRKRSFIKIQYETKNTNDSREDVDNHEEKMQE